LAAIYLGGSWADVMSAVCFATCRKPLFPEALPAQRRVEAL